MTCNIMKTCSVGKQDCALPFRAKKKNKIRLQSQVCVSILKLHNFLCCNLLKESHSDGTLYNLKKNNKRKFTKENKSRAECVVSSVRHRAVDFCVTLKMCLVGAANEEIKGQRFDLKKQKQTCTLCPKTHVVFIQGNHSECFPCLL